MNELSEACFDASANCITPSLGKEGRADTQKERRTIMNGKHGRKMVRLMCENPSHYWTSYAVHRTSALSYHNAKAYNAQNKI